jgi:adenosylcobinamide-GDP ribazoletransferase
MQILSKLSLVLAVDLPYARKDGLGKINIDDKTVTIAFLIVGFFCGIFQLVFSFSLLAVVLSTVFISRKIIKQLGGLTGDTYGAIHEINSIVVLFVYLFF